MSKEQLLEAFAEMCAEKGWITSPIGAHGLSVALPAGAGGPNLFMCELDEKPGYIYNAEFEVWCREERRAMGWRYVVQLEESTVWRPGTPNHCLHSNLPTDVERELDVLIQAWKLEKEKK